MRFSIFAILLIVLISSGLHAQQAGQLDFSVGLNLGRANDQLENTTWNTKTNGFKLQMEYRLLPRLAVNTSYAFANADCFYKFRNLNIGSKYYFLNNKIQAYGLVEFRRMISNDPDQICYTIQFVRLAEEKSATGVNIGAGLRMDVLKKFFVFAETKWTSLEGNRQMTLSGIGFKILK
ncbi:MAG: porin family protein [Roseivirga sp.]|nr:porin family protein [Roseivirga sp.]